MIIKIVGLFIVATIFIILVVALVASAIALIYDLDTTEEKKPSCYMSNPSYQSQAENCCEDCDYQSECIK